MYNSLGQFILKINNNFAKMLKVKGIEFDYIIIAGTNDGIVPLDKAISSFDASI